MGIRGATEDILGGTALASASGDPSFRLDSSHGCHTVIPYHAIQMGFIRDWWENLSHFFHKYINVKRLNTGLLAPSKNEAPVLELDDVCV